MAALVGRKVSKPPFEDYTWSSGTQAGTSITVSDVPFWGEAPDAWNTVILAGITVPGIAKVGGKAFDIRMDRKSIPGEHGEKQTTLGREPCDPEIEVRLWTADHLTAFLSIVKAFMPKSQSALPPPIDAIHPALAMFRIKAVRVMSCSFPEEHEPGVFVVKMRCREFIRGSKTTKPQTDDNSITSLGPGAVAKKANSFKTPDVTNGNEPRSRQSDPSSLVKPPFRQPGGT